MTELTTEAGRALLALLDTEPIMDIWGVAERIAAIEAEAKAAAEQRLEDVLGPLVDGALIPDEYPDYYLVRRADWPAVRDATPSRDTPTGDSE